MGHIIIDIRGTQYRCTPFYDTDNSSTNVDVYLEETYWDDPNSSYLGEVEDIEIPDIEDKDALNYFTDQIEDWLNGK